MNTWKEVTAAAGAASSGEALPAHVVSLLFWKCVTSFNITYSFQARVGCRDSGSSDFWFPPRCCIYLKLCLKVKTKYTQTKKPLLICFSTLCLHIPFHQESSYLSLCCRGLMRLSEHTCALRKIPLLSLKLYYSAQGRDSQCF